MAPVYRREELPIAGSGDLCRRDPIGLQRPQSPNADIASSEPSRTDGLMNGETIERHPELLPVEFRKYESSGCTEEGLRD